MGKEIYLGGIRVPGPNPGEYVDDTDPEVLKYTEEHFKKRNAKGKKRIMVGSLTLTMVPFEAYGSHCTNFYQLGRDHPEYDVALVTPKRMAIDDMRNTVVSLAVRGGFDYLYFFDDDTVNPNDVLGRLLPRMDEFNAISAGYFVRGHPFHPMVFRWKYKNDVKGMELFHWKSYKRYISEDNVLRDNVAAVGNGCTLYRVEDFKKVPYPWFKTAHNHTEDVWFFFQAHAAIPDYKVGMDFNVDCGHLLNPIYVDQNNVNTVRQFYSKLSRVGGISQ